MKYYRLKTENQTTKPNSCNRLKNNYSNSNLNNTNKSNLDHKINTWLEYSYTLFHPFFVNNKNTYHERAQKNTLKGISNSSKYKNTIIKYIQKLFF